MLKLPDLDRVQLIVVVSSIINHFVIKITAWLSWNVGRCSTFCWLYETYNDWYNKKVFGAYKVTLHYWDSSGIRKKTKKWFSNRRRRLWWWFVKIRCLQCRNDLTFDYGFRLWTRTLFKIRAILTNWGACDVLSENLEIYKRWRVQFKGKVEWKVVTKIVIHATFITWPPWTAICNFNIWCFVITRTIKDRELGPKAKLYRILKGTKVDP